MTTRSSMQASSSTLVQPTLALLADPPSKFIDAPAMDYFLIEMVNTLKHSAAFATARSKKIEQEMIEAGLIPPPAPLPLNLKKEGARDSVTSLASRSGSAGKGGGVDEEEEAVRVRLEAIGMHVGGNYTERCVLPPPNHYCFARQGADRRVVCRLCRDRPMFAETLDVIKFICKDIWSSCWDKQVDNLRTNHRVR